MELIPILTLALVVVLLVLVIVLLVRRPAQPPAHTDSGAISALGALVTQNLREGREAQDSRLAAMDQSVSSQLERFEKRLHGFSLETSQQLSGIRAAVDGNLRELREDNNKKLDEMRGIVDEKLQKTLSDRMNESFRLVNERLEQVYRGLGEMQTLAQGVGDLKKVLTNVKTRGIVGEIQLGAILSDILAPEQYAEAATWSNSPCAFRRRTAARYGCPSTPSSRVTPTGRCAMPMRAARASRSTPAQSSSS